MSIFTKIVCFRGSAPDPAGGAYDAPPDPLVGFLRRFALVWLVTASPLRVKIKYW